MTPEERRQLEEQMRELDDAALLRLVVLERSQYRPEALDIAHVELSRRRLPTLSSPEEFWQRFPNEWLAAVGFCYRCWTETTDESPAHTASFRGRDACCAVCGSVVQTAWHRFIPLGRYRVIHRGFGAYVGRQLKDLE